MRNKFKCVLACVLGVGAVVAGAQENYSTWAQTRALRINTTAAGANVTEDVTNFPLLVRLNASNFSGFSQAAVNGADVRFTTISGLSRIPHQIERWDSANQVAEIWVLAPVVKANDSAVALRIYWGKPGAADSSSGSRVFDASSGYAAVFHMNEADTVRDASGSGLKGVPVGATPPVHVAASAGEFISGAHKSFPGVPTGTLNTGGAYRLATAAGGSSAASLNYTADSVFSISAWVNMNSFPASGTTRRGIITKTGLSQAGNGAATTMQYHLRALNPANNFEFADGNVNGTTGLGADANIVIAQWNYVSYVRSSSATATFYVYNAAGTAIADPAEASTAIAQDVDVFFGSFAGTEGAGIATGAGYFDGKLDEITFANRARSAAWVKLAFETQKPGATAVKLTTDGVIAVQPGNRVLGRDVALRADGRGLRLELSANLPEGTVFSIVDPVGRTVWSHKLSGAEKGARVLQWNGLGADGRVAGRGVYYLRAAGEGFTDGRAFTHAP